MEQKYDDESTRVGVAATDRLCADHGIDWCGVADLPRVTTRVAVRPEAPDRIDQLEPWSVPSDDDYEMMFCPFAIPCVEL